MNKLEYYILKIFQDYVIRNDSGPKYVKLDDQLLAVIKGVDEDELYIQSECILEGRSTSTFSFHKIAGELYKVSWAPKFKYIVGAEMEERLPMSAMTKELELIRTSDSPLSSYLKTL